MLAKLLLTLINIYDILQVEVTADTVASICASTAHDKNLYVVDAGGGKGYLSAYLALEHKIKVLGVDCNPNITINAVNRSEKLEVTIKKIIVFCLAKMLFIFESIPLPTETVEFIENSSRRKDR